MKKNVALPVLAHGCGRRQFLAGACAALLGLGLAGLEPAGLGALAHAEEAQTRPFTDSLGRTVEVSVVLERIAPSGHTANQVLLTMAPELMVGLSTSLSEEQAMYFTSVDTQEMPVFGAAFGAKGDMNKEAVAAAGAQIVIDTGEPKDGLAEDMDALQEQLGIPVVFINTPLDGWGDAYRMLGELLGMEERGEELASYCDRAYAEVTEVMAQIPEEERLEVAYLLGDNGLNAIAKGSYQGGCIDAIANNVVVVEKASGSGAGNEISFEQLNIWDPELIVFGGGPNSSGNFFFSVGDDPAWQGMSAIVSGNYYRVPNQPWTWLNNPPTVNQVLGLQWFARLCYPEMFEDTIPEVAAEYYRTFYGYELSEAELEELVLDAMPK